MTFAPQSLLELAAYWIRQGGTNLGIVGDADHAAQGVSYHLGADQLAPGAYSARRPRDRAGLSNAASAIDLGRLDGSYPQLRTFSDWLARRCLAAEPGTADVVEVIYSPDGRRVWGFKDGVGRLIPDYGDRSHLTHTHVSFFRDSEHRDKVPLIAPYFEDATMVTFTFGPDAQDGTFTSDGKPGHLYLRLADGTLHPYPEPFRKRGFGPVKLVGRGIGGPNDPRNTGYLVGEEAAFVIRDDGTWAGASSDIKHPVELSIGGTIVYTGDV